MPGSKTYTIRGNPEQMFRALVDGLPSGATVTGNSSGGTITALGARLVTFNRNENQLSVTVHQGILIYSERDIWKKIEAALKPYV